MKYICCLFIVMTCLQYPLYSQNYYPPTGNVGLGTNNPSEQLSVKGNATFGNSENGKYAYTRISWSTVPGTGASVFDNHRDLGDIGFIFRSTKDNVTFNEIMRLQGDNGYVGIGTSLPTEKLTVFGNVKFGMDNTGNAAYTRIGWNTISGTGASVLDNHRDLGDIGFIFRSTKDNSNFNELMRIRGDNGKVGIGTADPQAKLSVNGDMQAKRVKVTQNIWPDYVFDNSYLLPSLMELETFINNHKHLPGIPSAITIHKEGLDLGNNQALLLEKIEELTLYSIDQHKTIISQQNKLKAQEEQLSRLTDRLSELEQRLNNLTAAKTQ